MGKHQSERLNNDEFLKLIPHLHADEIITIEIKLGGVWSPMLAIISKSSKPNYLICNLCKQNLNLSEFKRHLQSTNHITALSTVEQFFHPYYTYDKSSEKLAKGIAVSGDELKEGIAKADEAIKNIDTKKFEKHKTLALQLYEEESIKLKRIITQLALKTDAKTPPQIFVEVTLSLTEMLQLEFSDQKDVWKKMLITSTPPRLNGNYTCVPCSKNLSGIITVNAHFNGYTHKVAQLATFGVRLRQKNNLTKNCSYQYGTEYTVQVNKIGKEFFKKEALAKINERGNSKKDDKSRNDSNNDENEDEKKDRFLDNNTKLPASLAEKANALANWAKVNMDKNERYLKNISEEGLIGVEYVAKYSKSPNSAPMYECCLCEVEFNEGCMQFHLTGYNHRMKYCEKHYPVTLYKYKDKIGHLKYQEFIRVMTEVLSKLAIAIENYHSRAVPISIPEREFIQNRHDIVTHLYSLPHASEKNGPSFERVVKLNDIAAIKQAKAKSVPAIEKRDLFGRFATQPTGKPYLNESINIFKCYELNRDETRPKSSRSRGEKRRRSRSPTDRSPESNSKAYRVDDRSPIRRNFNPKDIWKVYREEVSKAATKVEIIFNEYRTYPESYPMYDEEWNRFWKRRKEELAAQGIDHRGYNFQPDWVYFFKERLEQLFGDALHKSQVEVRMRLNIPLDAEEDSQPEMISNQSKRSSVSKTFNPPAIISYPHLGAQQKEAKISQMDSDEIPVKSVEPIEPIMDDRPNVIHVLRLMTALEDHLGSLGGKIMDLLTKALILEKNCPNDSDELGKKILNAENCALLETAMEKLKGILFAGLLEKNKTQSFNKVIQYIANLLEHADNMGWRKAINEFADKPENKELRNLIEVMQNKAADLTSQGQKSLSDTLMALLRNQKKEKNVHEGLDSSEYDNRQQVNTVSMGRQNPNNTNQNFGSNLNNRYKSNNPLPSLMSLDGNNRNTGLQSVPTNMYQNNDHPAFKPQGPGGRVNVGGGSGRNDYNNSNFNNSTNFMGNPNNPNNPINKNLYGGNINPNNMNNMNNMNPGNGMGNSSSSSSSGFNSGNFGSQNMGNMGNMGVSMNRSNDILRNPFAGDGPGNVGSINFYKTNQNTNQQWPSNKSNWLQYPINRSGKNM